jgi:hypothetical protein
MIRKTHEHCLALSGYLIATILCLIFVAIHNKKGSRETAGYRENLQ